jgi:hypothetical protein
MKNFNEWLSIRSNSYNETEGDGESGFDFGNIPGAKNSFSIEKASDKFSGALGRIGGGKRVVNKRQDLANHIKDIYDVRDPSKIPAQINKIKSDLRYLIAHLSQKENLDNIDKDEDNDDNDRRDDDIRDMDMDAEKDNRTNIETY